MRSLLDRIEESLFDYDDLFWAMKWTAFLTPKMKRYFLGLINKQTVAWISKQAYQDYREASGIMDLPYREWVGYQFDGLDRGTRMDFAKKNAGAFLKKLKAQNPKGKDVPDTKEGLVAFYNQFN